MCLGALYPKDKLLGKEEGVGYKGLSLYPAGGFCFTYAGKPGRLPINRWLKEEDWRAPYEKTRKVLFTTGNFPSQQYPLGFHIFLHYKDAVNYFHSRKRVRKVKYREGVAIGSQSPYLGAKDTVIAKEMLIIPKKRRKKNE